MNIIKTLLDKFKNLDDKIKKIMHTGFSFSFLLSILAGIFLFTYQFFYSLPALFHCGISLFRTSLMFACTFFIFAIGFDTIKKEIKY